MKKLVLKVLSAGISVAMVMSLAACGTAPQGSSGASVSSTASTVSSQVSSAPQSSTASQDEEPSSDAAGTAMFENVEEYINNPEVKATLDSLTASLKDSGMALEILGEGNRLTYEYTFDADATATAEALESAMDTQRDSFMSSLEQVSEVVKQDGVVMVVRYLDSEGNEIASREFTQE